MEPNIRVTCFTTAPQHYLPLTDYLLRELSVRYQYIVCDAAVNKGFLVGVNISCAIDPSLARQRSDVCRLHHFSELNILVI